MAGILSDREWGNVEKEKKDRQREGKTSHEGTQNCLHWRFGRQERHEEHEE